MQYDFKQVTLTFSNNRIGNVIITGFGEGDDVINVIKTDDGISMTTGAKGEVTTSKVANPIGTIDITLQAQSSSNSILNNLARTKESFAVNISENNSQKISVSSDNSYVTKIADNVRGKNAGERTWNIMCENMQINE